MPRKPDLSLIGQTFNNLKVYRLTDKYNAYNDRLYECICLLCGRKRLATKSNLLRGEIKDCGNHKPYKDITGRQFGRLTALYVTDIKTASTCRIWHCKCECGNGCDVAYNDLIRGSTKSCGCLHKDKIKDLYIDGTAPCKLDGSKMRSTNTSGVTGVWFDQSRGKWRAEIMFKRKKYYLGRYEKKADAIAARKEAEKVVFGEFLEWYEAHRKTAKENKTQE